ncbi:MAG: hypothetical protein ACK56I_36890, partial [bacterium]
EYKSAAAIEQQTRGARDDRVDGGSVATIGHGDAGRGASESECVGGRAAVEDVTTCVERESVRDDARAGADRDCAGGAAEDRDVCVGVGPSEIVCDTIRSNL